MGKRHFQIRESKRCAFRAPVEIRWVDSERQSHSTLGTSVDVSVYGLGIIVPVELPAEGELTVFVNGVEVCGGAVMRHSHPCESGFRAGLYFRLTLLMQNIPEIDAVLDQSLSVESSGVGNLVASLTRRFAIRCWRWMTAKTKRALNQPRPVYETAGVKTGIEDDVIS